MQGGSMFHFTYHNFLEKCGTSSSQLAFFTEHSAQFFDSLLASILVHADVRRSRFEESATKMSSILTLDETVQLLDIFLMFVSCRTDETSFRQWWKAFHSQFLDFIYGEWQNSHSVRGSKSDRSCIVGSLHVHISVASMLSDWLRHPLHSGSLLLQEDGQLCLETLEFLVGFCDRLLSSLLSSHEPNMKLLRSVVALYSDLLWHEKLNNADKIACYRKGCFDQLAQFLSSSNENSSSTQTELHSICRHFLLNVASEKLSHHESKTSQYFYQAIFQMLITVVDRYKNQQSLCSSSHCQYTESTVKLCLRIWCQAKSTRKSSWWPLQHIISESLHLTSVFSAFTGMVEDFIRLVEDICTYTYICTHEQFPNINISPLSEDQRVLRKAMKERFAGEQPHIFLDKLMRIFKRFIQITTGMERLANGGAPLLQVLTWLRKIVDRLLSVFGVTKERFACISNKQFNLLEILSDSLYFIVSRETLDIECRSEALKVLFKLYQLFGRSSVLLPSQYSFLYKALHMCLSNLDIAADVLSYTDSLFTYGFPGCECMVVIYCKAIQHILASKQTSNLEVRKSIVRVIKSLICYPFHHCSSFNQEMESMNTSATCITQKRNTRRTEKGKEEERDSTHLEEHHKEKVSGVREFSQSYKLSPLDENDIVDGYIDTQVARDLFRFLIKLLEIETDLGNKIACISTVNVLLVGDLHRLHSITEKINADLRASNSDKNHQLKKAIQGQLRDKISKMLQTILGYCSYSQHPLIVRTAVMSLSTLTSIYHMFLLSENDPLETAKSIIENLCWNAKCAGSGLWKYYFGALQEWLNLPLAFLDDRSLLSSITEALEAALVSRTEGVAREKLPISKTVEDTSALAVLVSLYQRYLLSDPVETNRRNEIGEGRPEALLFQLLYAYKFREGNELMSEYCVEDRHYNIEEFCAANCTSFFFDSTLLTMRKIKQAKEGGQHKVVRIDNGVGAFTYSCTLEEGPKKCDMEGTSANVPLSPRNTSVVLPLPIHSALSLFGNGRGMRPKLLPIPKEHLLRFLRVSSETPGRETYKMGLIYVNKGQDDQQSILENEHSSLSYHSFAASIGSLVYLPEHRRYMGGVPRGDYTMPYFMSPSTEIMFHNTVMFPTVSGDPQQISKKRQIGNDEVNIIWSEHDLDYDISTISTKFTNVYIILYPLPNGLIRVQLKSRIEGIAFGPLRDGMVIPHHLAPMLVRWTAIQAENDVKRLSKGYTNAYTRRKRIIEETIQRWKDGKSSSNNESIAVADRIKHVLPTHFEAQSHEILLDNQQLSNLSQFITLPELSSVSTSKTSPRSQSLLNLPTLNVPSSPHSKSASSLPPLSPNSTLSSSTSSSVRSKRSGSTPSSTSPTKRDHSSSSPSKVASHASVSHSQEKASRESKTQANVQLQDTKRFTPKSLHVLSLNFNRFTAVSPEIMSFQSLERLYLSHNDLKEIAPSICHLKSLKVLDLSFNRISCLPPLLVNHLTQLEQLLLHYNNISYLPLSLHPFHSHHHNRPFRLTLEKNPLLHLDRLDYGDFVSLSQVSMDHLNSAVKVPSLKSLCGKATNAASHSLGSADCRLLSSLKGKMMMVKNKKKKKQGRRWEGVCDRCSRPLDFEPALALHFEENDVFGYKRLLVGAHACSIKCANKLVGQLAALCSVDVGDGDVSDDSDDSDVNAYIDVDVPTAII